MFLELLPTGRFLIEQPISANNQYFYVKKVKKVLALFGHFSKNLDRKFDRRFFQPLRFFCDHFCVLQPKLLPVGKTVCR
jgi:hypothetical protein